MCFFAKDMKLNLNRKVIKMFFFSAWNLKLLLCFFSVGQCKG